MSSKPIQPKYTSDIDNLLQSFDLKHPAKSEAQQKEIEKYAKVHEMRDNADSAEKIDTLWDNF